MWLELGLPGIVFLGLCLWLVRKALKAARTEQDLEGERLSGALADELRAARARAAAATSGVPRLVEVAKSEEPRDPLAGADLRGANPDHVRLVLEMARGREATPIGISWVRSSSTHVVWCERRLDRRETAGPLAREVIGVARVENGAVAERWTFG